MVTIVAKASTVIQGTQVTKLTKSGYISKSTVCSILQQSQEHSHFFDTYLLRQMFYTSPSEMTNAGICFTLQFFPSHCIILLSI